MRLARAASAFALLAAIAGAHAGARVSAPDNFWSGDYHDTLEHKRAV